MRIVVSCEDAYEAKKLASLIYVQDSGETNIVTILNVIKNEIVIALRDKSAHSILLRDESHVDALADFLQSVIDKKHNIVRTATLADKVDIEKA